MKRFLFAIMAACGHPSPHQPTRPSSQLANDDPSCPLVIPGTSVTVEDTGDGAAFVFVTTGDVTTVRDRARVLAEARSSRETGGRAHEGHNLSDMIETHSTAEASEIDHGARVAFKATKPDDVAALQQELRMHAAHLTGDNCKMGM
jgi:hypothetical protein